MIIASINIRGLGGVVNRKYLKELVRKERLDFLAIQETKLEALSDNLCYNLWGEMFVNGLSSLPPVVMGVFYRYGVNPMLC
jgi:hypothetical protein